MKIAVTGKGGVGKTTLSALIARILSERKQKVLLIDADPDMNLAGVLGVPEDREITPITELKELIAERTGAKTNQPAPLYKMNPAVNDIPEKYCLSIGGLKLLVMGTVRGGGAGCACPENAFLKTLISHLFISRDESVVVDMEAGIEHLGRGTAAGVDMMLIIAEPGRSSLETARRIKKLAGEIGIRNLRVIINKVRNKEEEEYVRRVLEKAGLEILGSLGFSEEIHAVTMGKLSVFDIEGKILEELEEILPPFP